MLFFLSYLDLKGPKLRPAVVRLCKLANEISQTRPPLSPLSSDAKSEHSLLLIPFPFVLSLFFTIFLPFLFFPLRFSLFSPSLSDVAVSLTQHRGGESLSIHSAVSSLLRSSVFLLSSLRFLTFVSLLALCFSSLFLFPFLSLLFAESSFLSTHSVDIICDGDRNTNSRCLSRFLCESVGPLSHLSLFLFFLFLHLSLSLSLSLLLSHLPLI